MASITGEIPLDALQAYHLLSGQLAGISASVFYTEYWLKGLNQQVSQKLAASKLNPYPGARTPQAALEQHVREQIKVAVRAVSDMLQNKTMAKCNALIERAELVNEAVLVRCASFGRHGDPIGVLKTLGISDSTAYHRELCSAIASGIGTHWPNYAVKPLEYHDAGKFARHFEKRLMGMSLASRPALDTSRSAAAAMPRSSASPVARKFGSRLADLSPAQSAEEVTLFSRASPPPLGDRVLNASVRPTCALVALERIGEPLPLANASVQSTSGLVALDRVGESLSLAGSAAAVPPASAGMYSGRRGQRSPFSEELDVSVDQSIFTDEPYLATPPSEAETPVGDRLMPMGIGLDRVGIECHHNGPDEMYGHHSPHHHHHRHQRTMSTTTEAAMPSLEDISVPMPPLENIPVAGSKKHTTTVLDIVKNSPQHRTLASLLAAAGLTGELKKSGPFTVFAPTDAAFQQIAASLGGLSAAKKKVVLLYHVLGSRLSEADVIARIKKGQTTAPTLLAGQSLRFSIPNGLSFAVNETVSVTTADLKAANGFVHVVNAVLLPASLLVKTGKAMPALGPLNGTSRLGKVATISAMPPLVEVPSSSSGRVASKPPPLVANSSSSRVASGPPPLAAVSSKSVQQTASQSTAASKPKLTPLSPDHPLGKKLLAQKNIVATAAAASSSTAPATHNIALGLLKNFLGSPAAAEVLTGDAYVFFAPSDKRLRPLGNSINSTDLLVPFVKCHLCEDVNPAAAITNRKWTPLSARAPAIVVSSALQMVSPTGPNWSPQLKEENIFYHDGRQISVRIFTHDNIIKPTTAGVSTRQ